jgi:hypothetical protein
MSEPFFDESDVVSPGELSRQEITFIGWDDNDNVYLELDFTGLDDPDDDLP